MLKLHIGHATNGRLGPAENDKGQLNIKKQLAQCHTYQIYVHIYIYIYCAKRFGDSVVSAILNLDTASPSAKTSSLFNNGAMSVA